MKNITEKISRKGKNHRLKTLANRGNCRKFVLTTNNLIPDGFSIDYFHPYIYCAGGLFIHWMRCLSLLTGASGYFFAPAANLLTSKSNDR